MIFMHAWTETKIFFLEKKNPGKWQKVFLKFQPDSWKVLHVKKSILFYTVIMSMQVSPFILQITFFHVAHSDWSWQKQTFWGYRKSVAHFFCSSSCDQRGFVRSCLHVRDRHKVAPNNSCSTDSCIDRNQVTSTVWVFYKNYMKKVFYNFTDLLHLIFQSVV